MFSSHLQSIKQINLRMITITLLVRYCKNFLKYKISSKVIAINTSGIMKFIYSFQIKYLSLLIVVDLQYKFVKDKMEKVVKIETLKFDWTSDRRNATVTFKLYAIQDCGASQYIIEIIIEYRDRSSEVIFQLDKFICQDICACYDIQTSQLRQFLLNLNQQKRIDHVFSITVLPDNELSLQIQRLNIKVRPYALDRFFNNCIILGALKIINFLKNIQFSVYLNQIGSLRESIIKIIDQLDGTYQQKQILYSLFMFNSKIKNIYDKKIYSQQRFLNGSIEQALTYNPTFTTQEMIKAILDNKHQRLLLYGQAGIGKSISMSLITILFSFISRQRIRVFNQNDLLKLLSKNQQDLYRKIPFLFYFTFKQNGNNLREFYDILRRQLPCRLIRRTSPIGSYKELLGRDFQSIIDRKDVYFEFDQINYYYSLIRKGENVKQINNITQLLEFFMKDRQSYKIIFNSSENLQIFYPNVFSSCRYINILQYASHKIKFQKIYYERRNIQLPGSIEVIYTIQFQYEKILNLIKNSLPQNSMKQQDQQAIQVIQNLIINTKKYFNDFLSEVKKNTSLMKQFHYFSQSTHDRIASFLKFYHNVNNVFYLELQQVVKSQNMIPTNFRKIFQELHSYIIRTEGQKYLAFVEQSLDYNVRMARYCQILCVRRQAQQLILNNHIQKHFDYDLVERGDEIIQISRQHSQIIQDYAYHHGIEKKKYILRIYYSPSTFIRITNAVLQKMMDSINTSNNFIHFFSNQKVWLGITAEATLISLQTISRALLQCHGSSFLITACSPFTHFHHIKSSTQDNSIFKRFQAIFQIFDKQDSFHQNEYICATPVKKADKRKKRNVQEEEQISSNSQAIDCILIKRLKSTTPVKEYEFITIDFCASYMKQYIKNKIVRSVQFFKEFQNIYQRENREHVFYQLNRKHYIAVPNVYVKLQDFKFQPHEYQQIFKNKIELINLESIKMMRYGDPSQVSQNAQWIRYVSKIELWKDLGRTSQQYRKT